MESYPYLPLRTIAALEPLARDSKVSEVARSKRGFLTAYKKAGGKASNLSEYWRNRRDGFVARHLAQMVKNKRDWYGKNGAPTRQHLALIMWAYSPDVSGLRDYLKKS